MTAETQTDCSGAAMTENRLASVEDMAAVDFNPWPAEDLAKIKSRLTNQEMADHMITVRTAWAILGKTKPELMETLTKIDDETGTEMFDGFVATTERLKALLELVSVAETRLLCAGAAVELQEV